MTRNGKRLISLLASGITAFMLVVVGPASMQSASATCSDAGWRMTRPIAANSTNMTSSCAEIKARYIDTDADYVRGWYYSPTYGWQTSGQGWKLIQVYDDTNARIIVNVVYGTTVRGQTQNWPQDVLYSGI